jgi:hypothetical protein
MKKIILAVLAALFSFIASAQVQLGNPIDGEAEYDESGSCVSLSADGSIVAIGAGENDGNGTSAGQVRVFKYSGGVWSQLGADIDGEASGDFSGRSVSLSADGSIVAIGAGSNSGNGRWAGHVRVYKFTSGTWNQLGADIDGEAEIDQSGTSVSLSGDGSIVAIGAIHNGGKANNAGHVRVYKFNAGSWNQLGVDIDGKVAQELSGWCVSLSNDGSTVAIGSETTNAGLVRVFKYNAGAWKQVGVDIVGEASGDQSARSVSLSADGNTVAIGAPFNDGKGDKAGHVRVYNYNAGLWKQLGADIDGEAYDDNSGWSVSLSSDGSLVAIGSPYNNNGFSLDAGHARIFQYNGSVWNQLGDEINGEVSYKYTGTSVSLSGDGTSLAIGTPWSSGTDKKSKSGQVKVYSLRSLLKLEPEETNERVKIYPNPASENITITVNADLVSSKFCVYDHVGRVVLSGELSNQNTIMNLSSLSRGYYLLSIGENRRHTVKISLQ